ncbi:MAG: hypothetical protein ACRELB_00595 [Polyangiaceae bacterium]
MTESAFLHAPPRRNRRFFSFHRPHLCRGCGSALERGAPGERHISRARDAYRVRNRFAHACPQCLGSSELADLEDTGSAQQP